MSKFVPINAPPSASNLAVQPSPSSAPERPNAQAIVSSVARRGVRKPSSRRPRQLRDRDFTVEAATSKRVIHNEEHYKIKWKDSVIERSYIKDQDAKVPFVLIEGKRWNIKRYNAIESEEDGTEMCNVEWCETWS